MAKITLEIDMDKLTERGHEALKTLMADIANPISPGVPSLTIEHMADKVYARMARKPSMVGVLDKLLDKKILTYKEVCDAAGHKDGGPALAGVVSSMTRNWQRYGGKGRFMEWNESANGEWLYQLVDAGMMEPLRKAREKFKKSAGK